MGRGPDQNRSRQAACKFDEWRCCRGVRQHEDRSNSVFAKCKLVTEQTVIAKATPLEPLSPSSGEVCGRRPTRQVCCFAGAARFGDLGAAFCVFSQALRLQPRARLHCYRDAALAFLMLHVPCGRGRFGRAWCGGHILRKPVKSVFSVGTACSS